MNWDVRNLDRHAIAISASRRTDIPGLFAAWFDNRLTAGFAEYIPAGPPRRIRRSLRPEDVTYFNFWTKYPRPFLRVLDRVLGIGYPVLWNVTLTGLGQTAVEPHVPPANKVVDSIVELRKRVPAAAIQWRYDPIVVSKLYDRDWHEETFRRLADQLAGNVDRIAVSFIECYGKRVKHELEAYRDETGDHIGALSVEEQLDVVNRLKAIADNYDLSLTICCSPELRKASGCPASGCNSFDWACRVYPCLHGFRRLRQKPMRPDCACSEEVDIGVYDTCIYGCRYSYGSYNCQRATVNFKRHDPTAPCLIP